jgi:hypothetical protein
MFGIESAIGKISRNAGTGRPYDISGDIPGLRKRLMIETAKDGVKGQAPWNS